MKIVGNDIEEFIYDYGLLKYIYGIDFIYFKHQMVVKIKVRYQKVPASDGLVALFQGLPVDGGDSDSAVFVSVGVMFEEDGDLLKVRL